MSGVFHKTQTHRSRYCLANQTFPTQDDDYYKPQSPLRTAGPSPPGDSMIDPPPLRSAPPPVRSSYPPCVRPPAKTSCPPLPRPIPPVSARPGSARPGLAPHGLAIRRGIATGACQIQSWRCLPANPHQIGHRLLIWPRAMRPQSNIAGAVPLVCIRRE